MHNRSLGLSVAAIILVQAASLSAAYAGPKSQHNSSVKAQCVTDAHDKGLTGKAYHDALKQCYQGSAFTR